MQVEEWSHTTEHKIDQEKDWNLVYAIRKMIGSNWRACHDDQSYGFSSSIKRTATKNY